MTRDEWRRSILARPQRLLATLVGLGAASTTACSSPPRPCLEPMSVEASEGPSASEVPNASEPVARESQTLVGRAEDAKAGAVVLIDDVPHYVEGLRAWPDELRGQRVEVTGRVVTRQGLEPIPPDEPQVAGIVGPYQVIEGARWRLAP